MADATTGYISALPQNDPNALAQVAFNYMKANVPGWEPSGDAVVEVWLITALAFLIATLTDLAGKVPDTIFRYFAQSLLAPHLPYLAPIDAAPAHVASTWTAIDAKGYRIPAGTTVGYQTSGDTVIPFTVDTTVVIAPGDSSATNVQLTAVNPGIAGNGLTSTIVPVDDLAWVASISATGTPSGGVAAETDRAYLDRLSLQLELLAPRAILPGNFAAFALNYPGVAKSMAIDEYKPPRTVTDCHVTSGSDTLTSATAVFSTADVGSTVVGTGIPGGTHITDWTDASTVTMSADATSSGAGRTVTIGSLSDVERCVTVAVAASDGTALTDDVKAGARTLLAALREVGFLPWVIDPTSTTVDVGYQAKSGAGYEPGSVQDACDAAINAFLTPLNWGGAGSVPWPNQILLNDIVGVLYAVPGVVHVPTGSVTLNGVAADLSLTGVAPLPAPGTIAGLVTAA